MSKRSCPARTRSVERDYLPPNIFLTPLVRFRAARLAWRLALQATILVINPILLLFVVTCLVRSGQAESASLLPVVSAVALLCASELDSIHPFLTSILFPNPNG
jgi:hypothetical protein